MVSFADLTYFEAHLEGRGRGHAGRRGEGSNAHEGGEDGNELELEFLVSNVFI